MNNCKLTTSSAPKEEVGVVEGAAAADSVGMSVSGYNGHAVHLHECDWMFRATQL